MSRVIAHAWAQAWAHAWARLWKRIGKPPEADFPRQLVFFWIDVGGPVCGEFNPTATPGAEGRRGVR